MEQLTLSKSSAFSWVALVLYLVHPIPKSEEVGASHAMGSVLPCALDPSPDPAVHPCFFISLYPTLEGCTGGRTSASKPRRALELVLSRISNVGFQNDEEAGVDRGVRAGVKGTGQK